MLPTRGKAFWTTFMQNGFGAQALRIHVASENATNGTVSMPLLGWSQAFSVAANGVTVIDVPTSAELSGSGSAQGKGVLIQAQDTVNVYMASLQNYTHDLSQVLPVNSLGTLYRVDAHHGLPNFNNLHKSEFAVLAIEDGTQVRITPSANTANGQPAGVPFIVNLNAGQAYQVQAATDLLNLTGSLIEGTDQSGPCRTFVVLGGTMCGTSPAGCSACDHIFEQCLPVTAWGTRYHTVMASGIAVMTYRILAHQDGTLVTIDGGAPIALNAGQRHEVSGSTAPACIEANLPISVAQLLEGYSCAGAGDPSLMLLSPDDRASRSARFHTSNNAQVNAHSVSIVVPASATGQVQIDGVPLNPALFQAYAACSDRKHARIPITAGAHRITCPVGFQAYAIGTGAGESYASSVNNIASVTAPQDSVVCGSGPLTLNSPFALNNAEWVALSDPLVVIGTGNSITITPTQSESYRVSGQLPVSGCPSEFTFHVGSPLTIPTLLSANGQPSINVCQYQPVQLSLEPPPDPAWFNVSWWPVASLSDAASNSPLATPSATTWYGVQVSSPSGCGDMTDSILVTVQPGAIVEMETTAQPATVCLGNTTQLSSQVLRRLASDAFEAPADPMWSAVQGGTISTACGSASGTALYFNGNGQRSAQTVAYITTGGGVVRFKLKIANGSAPCEDADPGDDIVLEYSNNNGINWNVIATYNEAAFPGFAPVNAAIPSAAQTASTMFRLRQLANQGAGHDNWAIDDFLIARYDDGFASYAWSQPSTLNDPASPAPTATPTASGWYVLSATDPTAGCIYQDSVFVTVAPAFQLNVTPSTTLCSINGVQLNANPSSGSNIAYAWSPANGSLSDPSIENPIATPSQNTTYTVTATSGDGCTASGQTTITVGQLFGLSITAAQTTLCQGQSTALEALVNGSGAMTYSWQGVGLNDNAIPDPTATPTSTTTYTCTATHVPTGCQLTASITITVNSGYTADAGPDLTLCSTLGHQLSVQHNVPGAIYSWSPAANLNSGSIQSPSILVDATATYTVTVTDAFGCSVSDQLTITRAFAGVPSAQAVSACADAPPTLTAPAIGVGYLWSTGATTPSIVPNQSGPHTVTITDANGCQAISTFNVTLHPVPAVELGPDLNVCGNAPQTLNAGNTGAAYTWSTGDQTQAINVSVSGNYSVTVTTPQGCSASDAVNVQFNALPVDALQDASACITSPPTLDAGNPGSSYAWSTGATTQSITPSGSGAYTVTVTTAQGCSASFDALVTLAPEISVSLGNDTTICQGQPILLDAGNAGASFAWSTGAQTQSISTGEAGNYSVTVSNGYCAATDAIAIDVAPAPVNALSDVLRCVGESATLNAGNAGATYLWSTGVTTQSITVSASGSYSVTVTNAAGCAGTFSANAEFIAPPSVELGQDTVLCEGQLLQLDAGNPGCTYQWSNGSTSRAIMVGTPGTYSVTAHNGACSRSDAITVHFNPSPARMAVNEFHACLDDEPRYVVIDAGNAGSRYDWSTGATTRVIMASAYGWYYVHITNQYDCSTADSARVIEHCPATIFIPNTFTPNGDGVNDIFIPQGKSIATMVLRIFDRWGEQLFESDDPAVGWDGTYAGANVPDDVYVWRLEYAFFLDKDGTIGVTQNQLGHIQVLR
ncbi:MAG: gliding motility-associated C-terminal domain-containing protein [Flavobacteriales bacterium]|nr:gliding motility-associated C-terminal domain-containing protein [Flavobacteriales bacterium]